MYKSLFEDNKNYERKIIRLKNNDNYELTKLKLNNKTIVNIYQILDEELIYKQFDIKTGEQKEHELNKAPLVHKKNVINLLPMKEWGVLKDKLYMRVKTLGNKTENFIIEYK